MDQSQFDKLIDNAVVLFDSETIDQGLTRMAQQFSEDYSDLDPVVIGVINGAIVPLGHFLTKTNIPLQLDYAHASRYHGEVESQDQLVWHARPTSNLEGRHVIIFDDILDGGITLQRIVEYCESLGTQSVKTMVMIDKTPCRLQGGLPQADYCALTLDHDAFVVGFGLDYKGYLRNLEHVIELSTSI